jgi:hypothetical protein
MKVGDTVKVIKEITDLEIFGEQYFAGITYSVGTIGKVAYRDGNSVGVDFHDEHPYFIYSVSDKLFKVVDNERSTT